MPPSFRETTSFPHLFPHYNMWSKWECLSFSHVDILAVMFGPGMNIWWTQYIIYDSNLLTSTPPSPPFSIPVVLSKEDLTKSLPILGPMSSFRWRVFGHHTKFFLDKELKSNWVVYCWGLEHGHFPSDKTSKSSRIDSFCLWWDHKEMENTTLNTKHYLIILIFKT